MATTYEAIATVTVGSGGAANIEFTNIPQTYTDLKVVFSAKTSENSWVSYVEFNGTTANRSQRILVGNGATASSSTNASAIFISNTYASATNAGFSNAEMYIPNYTSSNAKAISIDGVSEANQTTSYVNLQAGLYNNSSAITSIKFTESGATIQQYSTATLYGIKNS